MSENGNGNGGGDERASNGSTTYRALLGRYFHIFHSGALSRPETQGQVVASLGDGYYLVQLFDWFTGQPTTLRIVAVESMTYEGEPGSRFEWRFYQDAEQWRAAASKPPGDEPGTGGV